MGSARRATSVAAVCWLMQMPPEPAKFDVTAAPPHGESGLLAAATPRLPPLTDSVGSGRATHLSAAALVVFRPLPRG